MAYVPMPMDTAWQRESGIDLEKTAVVVVDVLGGGEGTLPVLEDMAAWCVRIVRAVRSKGVPVVFACDAHLPSIDRELELWGDHGIAGSEAAKPLDAFEVQPGDYVVPKRRYDAFFQTDLDLTLRELGVDTLVVMGCDTNICVMHTLAGAYFRGYRTVVPAEATATFLVGDQQEGLSYFARCFDTRVVRAQEALGLFA